MGGAGANSPQPQPLPLVIPAKSETQRWTGPRATVRAAIGRPLSSFPRKREPRDGRSRGELPAAAAPSTRHSRESGNPGPGRAVGTPLVTPSSSPPLSSFPRKREPRDGPGRGHPPRHPFVPLAPLPSPPTKSGNPAMDRAEGNRPGGHRSPPLVIPAKAGTQGWAGPGGGRPPRSHSPCDCPISLHPAPPVIPATAKTRGWAGPRRQAAPSAAITTA